jgi:hydrogenase-4 component E
VTAPGGLAYDLAGLACGAALALALAGALQRRDPVRVALAGLQAWVVATAAACAGWAQGQGTLVLAGIAVLAVNGVVLPAALRRLDERARRPGPAGARLGGLPTLVLSVLIVAAVVLAVQAAAPDLGAGLAGAVSAVLLGVLGMMTARGAPTQAAGLLATANGLVLLVSGIPHLPLAATLAVAVLAFCASGVVFLTALGADDLA